MEGEDVQKTSCLPRTMAQDVDAMRRAALMMIELRMKMMMRMRMLMSLRIRRFEVGDNGNQIENRRKQLDKTPAWLWESGGWRVETSGDFGLFC